MTSPIYAAVPAQIGLPNNNWGNKKANYKILRYEILSAVSSFTVSK
jgi:hypothetical protein